MVRLILTYVDPTVFFKGTIITTVVVLLIGVMVTFVLANRNSDSGFAGSDEDVYWDAFVANVKYDDMEDTTNSDHGFYVENGSTKSVTVNYEFTHRFMKGSSVLIPRKERSTKTAHKVNHPDKKKPRSAHGYKEWRVDVSSYSGMGYKIDAYTRLRLLHGSAEKNILDREFRFVVPDIDL